ncbi:uncharacterized protein LOC132723569 isoform X4 [Ruditapes philippinarum]|uniref:uncharacterized protein LOC132723569 isoform X4 n=1 Tax=Ruditapes philippinarum TaxID=129788 RepID=UPI00295ACEAA|nr:uncharacterized protein LOC132723569 isoform X4 [Ruditapes philippinarum]
MGSMDNLQVPKSSKCKKFIRLSPSSKKKHSKSSDSKDAHVSVPGSSGDPGAEYNMAKSKNDQRVPNGLNDHDLKQAFEMFDKNNDGKISSEELGCVLRALGHEHSHKEVEDMIKNADTNENGYVEYDEFISMMQRFRDDSEGDPNSAEAKKREAFKVFDMDGNGFIDKHELKYVMRRLGENLSDEDLKAMFSEADLNGDGLIDFDEFSRLHMA